MNESLSGTTHESKFKLRWMAGLICLVVAGAAGWHFYKSAQNPPTIKVGILNSRSGVMTASEASIVEGEMLAIEELNAKGGVMGRRIEPVIADGKSDWPTFATEATRLITEEKVSTIFGCLTSASRKTVKPVVERFNHLLIYPVAYEGLEMSPNIIYTGAAPNQQITPAVKWSYDKFGKKFFLVGSDYVWPRSVNAIIKDELTALGANLTGEEYIFFGSSDFQSAVEKIAEAKPDVILSSVVGDSNLAFYKALREAADTAKIPVVSMSIGEDEIRKLPANDIVGHYCAWNYFQSIDRPENTAFINKFKARYGKDRVTADVIEAAYFGVLLWAQAVNECGSTDVHNIREAMRGQSVDAPEGVVSIDPETLHTWRSFSIGKIRADGQLDIVWTSQKPIRPMPYPISRSKTEWDSFLTDMYTGWGNKWANPGKVN